MKRKSTLIILTMLVLTGNVFAQTGFNKATLLKDVLQRVGSDYKEVIAKNGKPLVETREIQNSNKKSIYLFYSGLQIHIIDNYYEEKVKFIYSYDPKFELIKGVCVGADIEDVLQILGDDYTHFSNPSVYRFERFSSDYIIIITVFLGRVTKIEFQNTDDYV